MSRYIDADVLIDAIENCSYTTWSQDINRAWWAQAVKVKDNMVACIKNTPTADVVEVVRCKDCVYWQDNNCGYPNEECRWGKEETPDADDYCSYGERR